MISAQQFSEDIQNYLEFDDISRQYFSLDLFPELDIGFLGEEFDKFVIWHSGKYQIKLTGFVVDKHRKPEVFGFADIFFNLPYELIIAYSRDYLTFRDFYDVISYGEWGKWLASRKTRRGQHGSSILARCWRSVRK